MKINLDEWSGSIQIESTLDAPSNKSLVLFNELFLSALENPEKEVECTGERLELLAVSAFAEAQTGRALFKRRLPSDALDLCESLYHLARQVVSPFGCLSPDDWKSFFIKKKSGLDADLLEKTSPVTLIIPVYNPGAFLESFRRRIEPISYLFEEIIVVDDGSTPEEKRSLVRACSGISNLRIEHLDENQGPAAARNFALSKLKSNWATFMDFDDELDPKSLPFLLEAVSRSKKKVLSYQVLKKPKNLLFVAKKLSLPSLWRSNQVAVNLFVHKDLLAQWPCETFYNEKLQGHFEDWELNLVMRLVGYRPEVLPFMSYLYNVHEQGRQSSSLEGQMASRWLLSRFFERLPPDLLAARGPRWMQSLLWEIQKQAQNEHANLVNAPAWKRLLKRGLSL